METVVSLGKKYRAPLSIFFIFLLLYGVTTASSIVQGDNAEFVTIAAAGGVPHEPGYPLYSLLTRIAFLLPFGNPTWQVNAFSALCGAAAVALSYAIVNMLMRNKWAALVTALILGTYESFWWYSITAEVYALQTVLLACMTLLLLIAYETKKPRYFFIAACIFGLGITNHYTVVLIFPLFLLALSRYRKKVLKTLVIAIFWCLIGLLPYIYTFFAASPFPVLNWGRIIDLPSLFRFLFRTDLGLLQFGMKESPVPSIYYSFFFFFANLFMTSWYVLPLFINSFSLLSKKNLTLLALFSCWVLFGPVFFFLIAVPERSIVHIANSAQYLGYAYFFFAILSGVGVKHLIEQLPIQSVSAFTRNMTIMLLIALFFSLPFFQTLQKVREDGDTMVAQITKQQLSLVPQNGILLVWSDSIYFPALYLQYVQNYRRDITIIQLGLLNVPWYQANLIQQYSYLKPFLTNKTINFKTVCNTLVAEDKVYMYPWYGEFAQQWQNVGCSQIPYGSITKITKMPSQNPQEIKPFTDSTMQSLMKELGSMQSGHANGYVRKRETLFYLSEHINFIGIFAMQEKKDDWALSSFQKAITMSPDQTNAYIGMSAILHARNQDEKAIAALREGIDRNPTNSGLYKNIAVLYQLQNDIPKAKAYFSQYVSFSPGNDPEIPKILEFIQNN